MIRELLSVKITEELLIIINNKKNNSKKGRETERERESEGEKRRKNAAKVIKGLNNPSDRGCRSSTRLNGTLLCPINEISLDDSDGTVRESKNG